MGWNYKVPWNHRRKVEQGVFSPLTADLNTTVLPCDNTRGHDRGTGWVGILPILGQIGPGALKRLGLTHIIETVLQLKQTAAQIGVIAGYDKICAPFHRRFQSPEEASVRPVVQIGSDQPDLSVPAG